MRSGLRSGAPAGAAGTTAPNAVTYLDVGARGRGSSMAVSAAPRAGGS